MSEPIDDGPALEELFANLPVSADWTMGFLTAICSGPEAIAPATWIPELVPPGDHHPTRQRRADLLVRLCGAVVETLTSKPEIIPPEPDKPAEDAAEFCRGYLRGARMHEKWRSDDVATTKLVPFEVLATATEAEEMHRNHLGRYVADLYAHWQSKRQVVHTTPKVGRNDPCPCGSGKKHKKCCLAA